MSDRAEPSVTPTEVRYRAIDAPGRRAVVIAVLLTFVVLGVLGFFSDHTAAFTCTRLHGRGTCTYEKRYPIGARVRTYAIEDVHGARVTSQMSRGNTSYTLQVDAGDDTLRLTTYSVGEPADRQRDRLLAFLRDDSIETFAIPTGAPPQLSSVLMVALPIVALVFVFFCLVLQSATIVFEWSERRVRLVRRYLLFPRTFELPLDGLSAKVEEQAGKGGAIARVVLIGDGQPPRPVLTVWERPPRCVELAQRLEALIRNGP